MADTLFYNYGLKTINAPTVNASLPDGGRREEPDLLHFTTDALPESELFPFWHQVSRQMAGLDVPPLSDQPSPVETTMRELPGVRIVLASPSPSGASRTKPLLADGNDNLCLTISFGNDPTPLRDGGELSITPRGAVLISQAEEATSVHSDRTLSFIVPRAALAARLGSLDHATGRPIPPDNDAVRLLATYAHSVVTHSPFPTLALREVAAAYIHDLMVLAIGASREAGAIAAGRGGRAARLRALKADVVRDLSRPDFSITSLAAAHSLSPRHVQRLFEESGTTFTEFVLSERLALARRLLDDPALGKLSIATVALESGFSDLSHFNRRFRQRYGCTPSASRAGAS